METNGRPDNPAADLSRRIHENDFYTSRSHEADMLLFSPFGLTVEPFLQEMFLRPETVAQFITENELNIPLDAFQQGRRAVGIKNGEYDPNAEVQRDTVPMVINYDEDLFALLAEIAPAEDVARLRKRFPPFDRELATALAHVTDPEHPEQPGMIAFNCGGNVYMKARSGRQSWLLATQGWLDSGYGPGAGGSRFMNGTSPALLSLEERIAEREGFKYSLVMNTGFNANEIAIRTLLTSGIGIRNYINGDFTPPVAIQARSGVHASVAVPLNEIAQQGYLADKKQTGVKPYFDPQNPETLVPVLAKLAEAPVAERVVFVNGVGSTDGVTYDLRRIQEICREYGALLYVDDAHGGFTLGRNAEGICEYLGLPEPPDFYFTTFSKSAENEGGALYTNHEGFVEAFKYQATSIYTAASTPQKLEMIHAKLDYLDAYPEGAGDALAKKGAAPACLA
ncbi:MAG: 8-amino-7-oxononanoate synthase [candidate division WS6 bacterium OLB20]|uniref:8-amino-7-oxononanoate synthase n=1 Tax=candidate division WS6 bacterium OLB20 TaxID=1617426 RepID=A0A136LYM7_9BACT|nr:MAG: 8-amino-7-oxononanoate synthase [candidate division WS6 bacterium OLB20]